MRRAGYFKNINNLLRLTRLNLWVFLLSVGVLMISSLFEGVSVGLLIPLLGLLMKNGDMAFLTHSPMLRPIAAYLPSSFENLFLLMVAGITAAILIKNGLIYASELIVSKLSRETEHVLRTKIYRRYLSFSKIFFDQNMTGHLNDLAINEVTVACRFFEHVHAIFLYSSMITIYFCAMLFLSWRLTVFAMILVPCTYAIIQIISKKIDFSSREKFKIDQEINSYMINSLGNMSLIQTQTNECAEGEWYERLSNAAKVNLNSIWKKALFTPHAQDVVLTLALAALLAAYVFTRPRSGSHAILEVSYFLSFFIFLKRFTGALSLIGNAAVEIARVQEPIRKILELFDDAGKSFIKSGQRPFKTFHDRITFENLSFQYAEANILKNISAALECGKTTAVVGATGSGKTTMVSMIPRFYAPTAGRICIDGIPLEEYELKSLRDRIAVVSQDTPIMNTTIRHNVIYGMEGVSEEALDNSLKKAHLYDFVMALPNRHDTEVGDRGVRLSGGERQRIAIARAILKNPQIFIFDEATSSLDMETELAIQRSIEEMTRGRTVIIVAHRLSTIRNSDHIIVLEKGALVEQGSFNELIARKARFYFYWNFLT